MDTSMQSSAVTLLTGTQARRELKAACQDGRLRELLGEGCWPPSKGEQARLDNLMERLDLVRPELVYRLSVLLLCFEKKKAAEAAKQLKVDNNLRSQVYMAVMLTDDLYFVQTPLAMKRFLVEYGTERYEFLEDVLKQQRKLFDQSEGRILARLTMIEEFKRCSIPVFAEDLAVTVQDLIEAGIPADKAEDILLKLLDVVHVKPADNKRDFLLKKGKLFYKVPLAAGLRKVQWTK